MNYDSGRSNSGRPSYSLDGLLVSTLAIVVFSFCVPACDSKDNAMSPSVSTGLRLTLRTKNQVQDFILGENVSIHVFMENTSSRDIVICAWPSREEYLFTFHESEEEISYKDNVSFEKPVSKDQSFLTVKAGENIQYLTYEFGQKLGGQYFDKVGLWKLKVIQYQSYTGSNFGLNAWKGTLISNVLPVNILPDNNHD